MVMTLMLLVVVPFALLRDFCCAKHLVMSRRKKSIAIYFCSCFIIFFLVDALILEKYIEHDIN